MRERTYALALGGNIAPHIHTYTRIVMSSYLFGNKISPHNFSFVHVCGAMENRSMASMHAYTPDRVSWYTDVKATALKIRSPLANFIRLLLPVQS